MIKVYSKEETGGSGETRGVRGDRGIRLDRRGQEIQ